MNVALIVGLNPALQRRVDLNSLAVGSVNRATSSSSGIGGKGQSAFVAALQLSHGNVDLTPKVCMFLGRGREGDALSEFLSQKLILSGYGEGWPELWIRTDSACRICTTLIDSASGDATEIVEPAGPVSAVEWNALLDAVKSESRNVAANGGCLDHLAILGTMPPGVPNDGYAQIITEVCHPRTKLIIDSVVNVEAMVRAAAAVMPGKEEQVGGITLKLNAREIMKLAGKELKGSDSQVAADPIAVAKAAYALADAYGAPGVDYVCFTDGPFPGGVIAIQGKRQWLLKQTQPLRGPVVSPIGAGDSTTAGTLYAWCLASSLGQDEAVVQGFAFGLAVGAASCLTGQNAAFEMDDVRSILANIAVTPYDL